MCTGIWGRHTALRKMCATTPGPRAIPLVDLCPCFRGASEDSSASLSFVWFIPRLPSLSSGGTEATKKADRVSSMRSYPLHLKRSLSDWKCILVSLHSNSLVLAVVFPGVSFACQNPQLSPLLNQRSLGGRSMQQRFRRTKTMCASLINAFTFSLQFLSYSAVYTHCTT